jgi:hypothetical protein
MALMKAMAAGAGAVKESFLEFVIKPTIRCPMCSLGHNLGNSFLGYREHWNLISPRRDPRRRRVDPGVARATSVSDEAQFSNVAPARVGRRYSAAI